jgi:hypothetical protein
MNIERLAASCVVAFAFAHCVSARILPTGYPEYPPADVTMTIADGRGHLSSSLSTNYRIIFESSESISGPWEYCSEIIDFPDKQRFFRAKVNYGFIFFESNFWVAHLVGIRPTNGETNLYTQSGFRLQLEDSWFDGISIYRVLSGPSTGDARIDYVKMFNELVADSRTQFVTPIDTAITGGGPGSAGQICYMGLTDVLYLQPNPALTNDELAMFDLQVVSRTGYINVRWTQPKSMPRSEFLQKLHDAGIEGDFNGTGCPL